ncbi:integrase core domain-containing protein [Rhodococcus qingshengii]|uniref:integrase core domain-containing protein n=1 Tax=Rhodococcus qingshengii TaxID=334542 RepID=UPI0035D7DCCC
MNVRKIPKRAGASTTPISEADAPKVVWAIDFQFDSTTDGRRFKIASMADEHTRQSVLNVVERSIPAEDLVATLEKAFALWSDPPHVLRRDNGPEFISEALGMFCGDQVGIGYVPPGQPWKNGYIESFNNRVRDECLNMNEFHSLLETSDVSVGTRVDDRRRGICCLCRRAGPVRPRKARALLSIALAHRILETIDNLHVLAAR